MKFVTKMGAEKKSITITQTANPQSFIGGPSSIDKKSIITAVDFNSSNILGAKHDTSLLGDI